MVIQLNDHRRMIISTWIGGVEKHRASKGKEGNKGGRERQGGDERRQEAGRGRERPGRGNEAGRGEVDYEAGRGAEGQ